MNHAFFIEDIRGLSDLFHLDLAPQASSGGRFRAYRVRHPARANHHALVLTGLQRQALATAKVPPEVGRPIQVLEEVDEGGHKLYWYDEKGVKKPFVLHQVDQAEHLYELIEPVPWRHEPQIIPQAILWLSDPKSLGPLIRRSLSLGNDRLKVASLGLEGDGEATLVRMESPAYYLLAWALEQPEKMTLYTCFEGHASLWCQWGYVHPLQTLWERVWAREASQKMVFFPKQGHYQVVEQPAWTDLYDLVDFSFDVEAHRSWEPQTRTMEKFHVPLSLGRRHEPAPCELVLLWQDQQQHIEDFLALSQEAEIGKLEISVQQGPGGERVYLIRERGRGQDTSLLTEFGGLEMTRYKGFDTLYLPVDAVLEPTVRRDQYRVLFDLQPHTLSLIFRDTRHAGRILHTTLSARSFEPLRDVVEHVVAFEQNALDTVLSHSIFDLKSYSQALSRPDLLQESSPKQKASPKSSAPPSVDPLISSRSSRLEDRLEAARQRQARRQAQGAGGGQEETIERPQVQHSELELLERDLERELILRGAKAQGWLDLAQIKTELGKPKEAALCQIEAIWTAHFPATPNDQKDLETASQARRGLLGTLKEQALRSEPLALAGGIIAQSEELVDQQGPQAIATLMEHAAALRHLEEALNKKTRWLAWRTILAQTQDVRTQEDVRTQLLDALNLKGLTPEDALLFIRERILTDPDLEFDDSSLEQSSDRGFLLQNIETVEKGVAALQTHKIRHATWASLARIYASMSMPGKATSLLEDALTGLAEQERAPAEAKTPYERVERLFLDDPKKKPEYWHMWILLNALHVLEKGGDEGLKKSIGELYEALKVRLSDYNRTELLKIEKSLQERAGKSKVAEFLSLDARPFFSSRPLPQPMQQVIEGLGRGLREGGQGDSVGRYVSQGITLALEQIRTSTSLEDVARLIMEMVNILRRMRWNHEAGFIHRFREFIGALSLDVAPNASRLYFAILHCAAARALMDLGDERAAMERLSLVLKWVGQEFMQVIDFADLVMNEVLLTFEMAPRNTRQDALGTLMEVLLKQEHHERGEDPQNPGMGFELSFQAFQIILMLDHTLEAAVSNEKLVQRRLRDYEEREEARLRTWLQQDQPAQPT